MRNWFIKFKISTVSTKYHFGLPKLDQACLAIFLIDYLQQEENTKKLPNCQIRDWTKQCMKSFSIIDMA